MEKYPEKHTILGLMTYNYLQMSFLQNTKKVELKKISPTVFNHKFKF